MRNKKRGVLGILVFSKAQVTIFIIFAVVIILSGMLFFFYQRQSAGKAVEIVQPEVAPIKQYVEDCLKSIAEDGLQRIGLSGGYINIPPKIDADQRTYLTNLPGSSFKMPYWRHDGIQAIPTEDFINQQLRSHIKNELKNCINNFEPFGSRFDINQLGEPIVDVKFDENDVSVSLKYQIEISAKGGNFKAVRDNFGYTIPVRFKKVYELAKTIMERENIDYFLERKTIDLYSMDTEIPTTDVEVRCSTRQWQLSSIKEKLKTLLRVNLPYIKVKGTDYSTSLYVPSPDGQDTYSNSYYNQHYIWDIDNNPEKSRNLKVSFAYENWPLSIYARPSENGILKSNAEKGAQLLKFLCLHVWHFTYDINYPVTVSILDKETNSNKAYQFNFAFMVSIDHNIPSKANRGTTLFETVPDLSSEDFCSDVQNEITIFTVDNSTGDDIRDVNLTFVCGRYYCDIGKSDWLSFGASAGLTKKFPYCVNGLMKGAKEGYLDSQEFIQTDVDSRSYILMLNPIKEFQNYKVVKHLLSNPSLPQDLGPNEKATIIIKGNDTSYETFSVYPKEADYPLLIPDSKDATYDVSIYVANEENIVGGYIGQWKVSKDYLHNSNEVVFHVVEHEYSSEDETILFVSGLESYSKNVPGPELK